MRLRSSMSKLPSNTPSSEMDSDPDPDPAIFVRELQDANKKLFFSEVFLCITFGRYIYIIFQR
jgi:hypothetical protein